MFLLSDGSMIWMWSASFAENDVGFAVSVYYCEIIKFHFWVICGDVVISDSTVGFIYFWFRCRTYLFSSVDDGVDNT